MAQPIKQHITTKASKNRSKIKKKYKKNDDRLPQVTIRSKISLRKERKHPEYGTSKLEAKFAKNFLDKLGVKYVYQYKAESIGRYFDFYLTDNHVLIEVDGVYFHGKGLTYEEKSPMQKHNERIDKEKDMWAASHGIPLIRIWEDDINEHPEMVMKTLKENIAVYTEKHLIDENKKKRH